MRFAQMFLWFGAPLLAAALAQGGAWKRLGWYAGTLAMVLLSVLVFAVLYSGSRPHPVAAILWPLSASVLMISLAALRKKKSK
jgi:hypothetical protein